MRQFLNIRNYFLLLLLSIQLISCNKTNWTENYREKEKSPFGTYILNKEVGNLFKGEEIIDLKAHIYDYLFENYETTTENFGTYILIKNSAPKIESESIKELLSFVEDGNTAFVALNYFSSELKKALDISTNNLSKSVTSIDGLKKLKGNLKIKDASNQFTKYSFDRNIKRHYIVNYNKDKTTVLGTQKIDTKELPVFIKIQHGKGAIFIHTNPIVFTNYFLLKEKNYSYTEQVFSFLPSSTILWDSHIKNSNYLKNKEDDNTSIFNFFLSHATLTWFLYTALAGVLLFLFFNAKRKQRPIPILSKPKNTTVAFTQTISSLYLKEQDHKNLVDKKITYFLEKVRTKYLLKTDVLNIDFIEKLALKSGNDLYKTKYLINTIITLDKKNECSEEELFVLFKMIDKFFKNNTHGDTK